MSYDVNSLESHWMPFTANRDFKQNPRIVVKSDGMYLWDYKGGEVIDGSSGLFCTPLGHGRREIAEAVYQQMLTNDYTPHFQLGHPGSFELAERVCRILPDDFNHVFFTNSGSEAVDTALKIALAYHRARGEGHRTRLIGREKGYHGVGFGGISVGGMSPNRKMFGSMLPGVDHLKHTHNLEHNAYSVGQPKWGDHLADQLTEILMLHDPSTVAAVIMEPIAGSAGVYLPPVGYLNRIREICDEHGILLILDEVITGFGRTGSNFGSDAFGVTPDIMTIAKGMTSGTVPMGGVLVKEEIYDTFMTGPEDAIEFFHGYTYSGHPLAAAAGLATLKVYEEEGLFENARKLAPVLEEEIHQIKGTKHVIDIRNFGLLGAVELNPIEGKPTARALSVFRECYDRGVLIRTTGDTIAMCPPFIASADDIRKVVHTVKESLEAIE